MGRSSFFLIPRGEPIYFIERIIVKSGRPFNDGEHIIYVNGAHKDVATELGKLVHDLNCSDPDDMFFKELADVVRLARVAPFDRRGRFVGPRDCGRDSPPS